jgi:WhiB family redox-sensing transcriptional regulator
MRTYPGTAWMMAGACRDTDPETFFPIGSVGPEAMRINDAKATCQRCPVVKTCLGWAIKTGQEYGVWGGQSEDERRLTRFHDGAVA